MNRFKFLFLGEHLHIDLIFYWFLELNVTVMAWFLTLFWWVKPIESSIKNAFRNTTSEKITKIGDSEYFFGELIVNFEFFSKSFGKMITVFGEQIIGVSLKLNLKVPVN